MLRSIAFITFSVLLSITTHVAALGFYPQCRSDAHICGEFLAWKACIDDLDYAIVTDTAVAAGATSSGRSKFVDHGYQPGYRVCGGVADIWCGWGLSSSFTYISDKQTDSVMGSADATVLPTWIHGGLAPGNGYISGEAWHKFRYQTFDLLASRRCCLDECHSVATFVGLEYLSIDRNYSASFRDQASLNGNQQQSPSDASMAGHADYRGVGVKVGAEYRYLFGSCLEFFSKASGTLTAGTRRRDASYSGSDSQTEFNIALNSVDGDVSESVCVPGYHIGAGFRYRNCWCGYKFVGSFGYEFLQWLHAPQIRRYSGAIGNAVMVPSNSGQGSLAFHGLNLGLGVTF